MRPTTGLALGFGVGGVALAAYASPEQPLPLLAGTAEACAPVAAICGALVLAAVLAAVRTGCGGGEAREGALFACSGLAWGGLAVWAAGGGAAAGLFPAWVALVLCGRAARERGWRCWSLTGAVLLAGAALWAYAAPPSGDPRVDWGALPWASATAWLGAGLHPLPRSVPEPGGTRLAPAAGWLTLSLGVLACLPALAAVSVGPPFEGGSWLTPGLSWVLLGALLGCFSAGLTLGGVALISGAVAFGAGASALILAGGVPTAASSWALPAGAAVAWGSALAACRGEVLRLPGLAAPRLALGLGLGGLTLVALGGSRAQAGWTWVAFGAGSLFAAGAIAAPLTAWFDVRAGQASRDPRRSWQQRLRARYRYRGPLLLRLIARRAARDPLLERLPRWLPAEGRLLVAGCGVGALLARIAQLPGFELSAVERNPRRLRVARSALRASPIRWIAGDPLTAPLERYHAIVVEDTLTAYRAATQERLLARLGEHLEPGGVLVLITPPPNGAWGTLLRHWALGLGDFPRSLLVPTDLGRVLNRCGLAVTHSQSAEGAWPRFVWVCKRPVLRVSAEESSAAEAHPKP